MPPTRPLRLSSPGDLVAAVPHLTGFQPQESLVALGLRGRRHRLGLTVRADLDLGPGVVGQVLRGLVSDGASACAVVVHTDEPSGAVHPHTALVDALVEALEDRGIDVLEVLLVRHGRWWSYRCSRPCCPPEGTPVARETPAVRALAAASALQGGAVLASRTELVDSLAARPPLGAATAAAQLGRAEADLTLRLLRDRAAAHREELERWRAALAAWEQQPAPPAGPLAAALVAALHVVAVRDQVACWALDRSDGLLGLLGELCRATPAPYDVPVCTVLAWVAYARGNGALALIGLERALASEPEYGLATLLRSAIDEVVPPATVRDWLREVA